MNLPTIWDVYFGSCCTFPSNIKETRIYFLYDSNMIWLTAMAGVVMAWAREERAHQGRKGNQSATRITLIKNNSYISCPMNIFNNVLRTDSRAIKYPLKVYQTVASVYSPCCATITITKFQNIFTPPRRNPISTSSHSSFSSPSSPRKPPCHFVSMDLPSLDSSDKSVVFCHWPLCFQGSSVL